MTAAAIAHRLAERAEGVAIALLGNPASCSRRELRFGRRGSMALRLDGAKRGHWYDHERGSGGDLLHLIARERGVLLGRWVLRSANFSGALSRG
jgi:putative DNA primase/helicase